MREVAFFLKTFFLILFALVGLIVSVALTIQSPFGLIALAAYFAAMVVAINKITD